MSCRVTISFDETVLGIRFATDFGHCDLGGSVSRFGFGRFVVSDATGRTGSLIGKALKEQDVNVRGFIQNATKTREKLGRIVCDASEGILVCSVTDPSTLIAPTQSHDRDGSTTGLP